MRLALKYLILVTACVAGLYGCGGSQGGNTTEQAKRLTSSQKTAASSYNQVVEQLYVAYFGRPADPNGLANFSAQLLADGAPTDIQSLLQAYNTNSGVKTLIDAFGTSTESKNLYGTANPTSFVTAVFNNVLGRAPQSAGLDFWVNALNNGSVTYGNVALQIMAGALVNNSTQGVQDAILINNRITVATDFTSTVSVDNATADYTGSTAAQTARTMLNGITASTSSGTFQSTVNSTVATIIANAPPVNNVAAITVDQGADPAHISSVNAPYVSVTICAPSNPSLCQTIDHVLVDTGSYGLRLIYSTLTPSMAAALAAQSSSSTLAECTQFLDGYTWGPIRQVNLSVAGETANNLTMQVIGDPNFSGKVPGSCTGKSENTVDTFGSNGVIGVGLFQHDCGDLCVSQAGNNVYFNCTSNGCNSTTVSLVQQVQNPVTMFPSDNNGVIVELPSVSPDNPPSTVSGTLVFGVNTQSNNALGSASVFQMDSVGNFTTIYSGTTMSGSFIDSGSNLLYFPNLTNIATCTDGFYCPSATLSLSAVMQGAPNLVSGVSNTQAVPFSIGYADSVIGSVSVDFGAPGLAGSFDWGLPFFFGRNVYVVQDGKTAAGQKGPLVAF
ncbi:MAG TPA: DUF3443 family protein [Burkholderiaceae bacterium]